MPHRMEINVVDSVGQELTHLLWLKDGALPDLLETVVERWAALTRVGIVSVYVDGVQALGNVKDAEPQSHLARRLYLTWKVRANGQFLKRYKTALSDPSEEVVSHLVGSRDEPIEWSRFRVEALPHLTDAAGGSLIGLYRATFTTKARLAGSRIPQI